MCVTNLYDFNAPLSDWNHEASPGFVLDFQTKAQLPWIVSPENAVECVKLSRALAFAQGMPVDQLFRASKDCNDYDTHWVPTRWSA